jgi:hypothetical protein
MFLAAGAVVAIAAVLVVASMGPARFQLERSTTIGVHPERVLALLEDLHTWPSWSAEKEDPTATRTYNEIPKGVGAVCEWDSRGSAGAGRMEIVEASPRGVLVQVAWKRPFVATNMNGFALATRDDSTLVTWTLDGEYIFILKLMGLVVGVDRLMGGHLERGLAALKRVCER